MAKTYAVILASGTGERMNANIPKQFLKIHEKTLIEYSIEIFEENKNIDKIIIVTNPLFRDLMEKILANNNYKKISCLLDGGKIRMESSFIGTSPVEDDALVLIHDGVRPFVSQRIINDCLEALKEHSAITVALPCVDTVIKVNKEGFMEHGLDRRYIMRVQTPQGFRAKIIKKAHKKALKDKKNVSVTDDCGLVKRYNLSEIYTVKGEERNIKITHPADIELGEKILEAKSSLYSSGS